LAQKRRRLLEDEVREIGDRVLAPVRGDLDRIPLPDRQPADQREVEIAARAGG
jgi:hypothetical protein